MTIRQKIIVPIIALAIVLSISFLSISFFSFRAYIADTGEKKVRGSVFTADEFFKVRLALSGQCAQRMAYSPGFSALLQKRDFPALLDCIESVEQEAGVDFTVITDAQGIVLLRSHSEMAGDDISMTSSAKIALTGKANAMVISGHATRLTTTGRSPVYNDSGEIIGAVVTGFLMDKDEYVDTLKVLTNAEISVFLGDTRIATTVKDREGVRITGTKMDGKVAESVLAGKAFFGPIGAAGQEVFAAYLPLFSDGTVVGSLAVGSYLAPQKTAFWNFAGKMLLAVLLTLFVLIAICTRVIDKTVAPIKQMSVAAENLDSVYTSFML